MQYVCVKSPRPRTANKAISASGNQTIVRGSPFSKVPSPKNFAKAVNPTMLAENTTAPSMPSTNMPRCGLTYESRRRYVCHASDRTGGFDPLSEDMIV